MRDSLGARSLESYRFGVFEFDGRTLELRKAGRLIAIRPQPLKLLALLLARPNDLVTRDDLQRALWGDDTFVDFEQGVNHAVRELRAALGDVAESPRFIETLPRRGYRFIAPVTPLPPERDRSAAEPATPASPPGTPPTHRRQAPYRRRLSRPSRRDAGRSSPASSWRWPAVLAWRSTVGRPPIAGTSLVVRPFVGSDDDRASGLGLAHAIAARLGGQRLLIIRPEGRGDVAADPWCSTATSSSTVATSP